MKILGMDTSTKVLCIGVCDGKRTCGYSLEVGTKLGSLITVTIERILSRMELRIQDFDYLACGQGPGSFTGLRVGIATVKGLSLPFKKPIVAISTLDILAAGAKEYGDLLMALAIWKAKPLPYRLMPIVDAKRSLIYTSIYTHNSGVLRKIAPYMLLDEQQLLAKIKPGTILFGDAVALYKDKIMRKIPGVTFLDRDYWYPKPHALLELGTQRIAAGKLKDAFRVEPLYLYPKECQIKK